MGFYSDILRISIPAAAAALLVSCASEPAKLPPATITAEKQANQGASLPPAAAPANDSDALRTQVTELSRKVDELELKLSGLAEKVNFAQTGMEQMLQGGGHGGAAVQTHASSARGVPVPVSRVSSGPVSTFINDQSVQQYRDANLLAEAGKQTEAIVAFSGFLRDHPDHPLAGSAQYHIGKAYYEKNELKLAREELQRVLVSYDRSAHVPETLALLAEVEDKLNETESAARRRQLLLSLFPQSPAALALAGVKPGEAPPPVAPAVAAKTASASPASKDKKADYDEAPGSGAAAEPADAVDAVPVTAPMNGKAEDEHTQAHH